MHLVHGRPEGRESERRTSTFSGLVYGDPVLATDDVVVNNVFFGPEGRTYWHSHEAGQLIFVHTGHGLVVTRAGEVVDVAEGDIVHSPSGEEHWHGAGPHTLLQHTAVSLGPTVWLEEVSEEDYTAATRHLR
jgi:quercetin dioxygenase-like cupin family protein